MSNNVAIELVEKYNERIFAIMNFGVCTAPIVVAETQFAPYHFVAFEVAAMKNGILTMPYYWYDEDGNTVEEIVNNLDKTMNDTVEYFNSQARSRNKLTL